MISIHTFEFKAALSRTEYDKIRKQLNIPSKRQSWTEHRYTDKGIRIILYKGKSKKFIYLKYIINFNRIFHPEDYLHLLKPDDNNLAFGWQTIKQTWDKIGSDVPFERFYLSRLDFTCDIRLKTESLVKEYIRLLGKSILLSTEKRFSVTGIHHGEDMTDEEKMALQQNCCKFKITSCENIQCYNKLYELKNENLPIPQETINQDIHILRIELQIHKTKRITELLQAFSMHNKPIHEQFAFFIKNADTFLLDRLEKLYIPGKYYKKRFILEHIKNDPTIRNKSREHIKNLIDDCNRNISLGRCLELDKRTNRSQKRKKALSYLSANHISPVCIHSDLKDYDKLPDIFALIKNNS